MQLISPPEFRLLKYLSRLVKSAGTRVNEKATDKAVKAFDSLTVSDMAHFHKYPLTAGAPNKPGEINFEDFKLFTRSVKYYSKILNEVCG